MRKVWLIALMLAAVFMLVVPVIYAQDVPFPCGGLSESDCADLQTYTEANAALDSATVDIDIDLTVTEDEESISFNLTGTGAYAGVGALASMATADPAAMANPQAAINLIKTLAAELDLNLEFPEAVLEMNDTVPESLQLQVVLVDGVGYVNFDTLSAIPNLPLEGWVGLDLAAVASQSLAMMGDMTQMPGMDAAGDPEMMAQFTDPAFLDSFIHIERAVDIPATFRYTFDFGALMSSEAMQEVVGEQLESMGTSGVDLDQVLAMYDGMVLTLENHYDGDSQLIRQSNINMQLDLDSFGVDDVSVEFNASFAYSGHNDTTISAPEDAELIPPSALFGGMMGDSSS